MEHFNINNERKNSGTFIIDLNLSVEQVNVSKVEYERMLRKSILYGLQWLEENVFINDNDGYKIKNILKNGLKFNSNTNQYIINSCYNWKKKLNTLKINEKLNTLKINEKLNTLKINENIYDNDDELLNIFKNHKKKISNINQKIIFDNLDNYKSSDNIIYKDSIDFNNLIMVSDISDINKYIPHFPVRHNDHWDIISLSSINSKLYRKN